MTETRNWVSSLTLYNSNYRLAVIVTAITCLSNLGPPTSFCLGILELTGQVVEDLGHPTTAEDS